MSADNAISKPTKAILWLARIWSAIILAFVLFFVIAHIFGEEEASEGFRSFIEIVQFICFPISTIIGLIVAFKFERLGGLVSVLGLLVLFVFRPDLIISPMTIMIIPGLLFIICWYLLRSKSQQSEI